MLALRATFPGRSLFEPQSISYQEAGVGFPNYAERSRTGGSFAFILRLLDLRMYRRIPDPGMETCPPCSGALTSAREATLAPCWLHDPQTISDP